MPRRHGVRDLSLLQREVPPCFLSILTPIFLPVIGIETAGIKVRRFWASRFSANVLTSSYWPGSAVYHQRCSLDERFRTFYDFFARSRTLTVRTKHTSPPETYVVCYLCFAKSHRLMSLRSRIFTQHLAPSTDLRATARPLPFSASARRTVSLSGAWSSQRSSVSSHT